MAEILQPHIKLAEVSQYCILTGNPDRVPLIASYLDHATKVADHRGLIAFKGVTKNKRVPVTILTTGMGTGSSALVLEEAFRAGGRDFLRIGSTGSLQPGADHGIGSIYIPFGAIRDEGTSDRIAPPAVPAVAYPTLHSALIESAQELRINSTTGLIWTTDVYYQPDFDVFKKWAAFGATCVEMESSLLFTFCASKNYEARSATILISDGNLNEDKSIYVGDTEENIQKFNAGVEKSIRITLNAIEIINS